MRIFVDTEFTDFVQIDLISIALVSEDGREFYAERNDYRAEDCSDFVREAVLPLLGRIEGATCNRPELTQRLRAWFEELPEPATLLFDYFADWELLADAFLGDEYDQPPKNVGEKQMLTNEFLANPIFQRALYNSFTPEWPAHHALVDARAFRRAFFELIAGNQGG